MKEIKFRAWDAKNKKFRDIESIAIARNNAIANVTDTSGEVRQVNNGGQIIISQFTGLKDKNGKEVYEGDIVEEQYGDKDRYPEHCKTRKFKIMYLNCGFYEVELDVDTEAKGLVELSNSIHPIYTHMYKMEVIGNIYENPELLN